LSTDFHAKIKKIVAPPIVGGIIHKKQMVIETRQYRVALPELEFDNFPVMAEH